MTTPRLYEKCECGRDPRVIKLAHGVFKFILSTADTDCEGDRIDPRGWKLERFRKNPVVLLAHDMSQPIARARKVAVENGALVAEVVFPKPGADELADTIRGRVDAGLITAASVGFRMLEWKERSDGGRDISSAELIETSLVSIPCNRSTVRIASMKSSVPTQLEAVIAKTVADAMRPSKPKLLSVSEASAMIEKQFRKQFRAAAVKEIMSEAGCLDEDGIVIRVRRDPGFGKVVSNILAVHQEKASELAEKVNASIISKAARV